MSRKRKKTDAEKVQTVCNPIPCSLKPISEYPSMLPDWNPEKKKLGRYSGSVHTNVPPKHYVVLASVTGDFIEQAESGLTDHEILQGCLSYLSTAPHRKKYAKRAPKAPYGKLSLVNFQRHDEASGLTRYTVVMTTDQYKNKYFWGQGYRGGK